MEGDWLVENKEGFETLFLSSEIYLDSETQLQEMKSILMQLEHFRYIPSSAISHMTFLFQ